MAASKTVICNIAISHLGIGKEIADLDTEDSQEANTCRRYYDISKNQTLRDFPWSFTSKMVTLALVESNPTGEWDYSYRYPSDCLKIRRILSGLRNDSRQNRVAYKIVRDDTGLLIYSDMQAACVEYTAETDNTTFYPDDFTMALSFRLAHYIAPRITSGDPFKMGQRALEMYNLEISRAESTSANEEQNDQIPDSEFIRVREGHDGFGNDGNNNGGFF